MKIQSLALGGLQGPVLQLANLVQRVIENLRSVPLTVVADVSALPNATLYQGRQLIVRDIDGLGGKGIATALDGAWYDQNWSAL